MRAISNSQRWTGRILSGLAAAFLVFDGAIKVAKLPMVMEGTAKLGFPQSSVFTIGVLALIGVALYLVRRTAVLGAIFLTGFLGGAIAAHVRLENPLFSHTLFPVYVATFLWAGLFLRDARLRALLTNAEPSTEREPAASREPAFR
jgi:hypothetical protein